MPRPRVIGITGHQDIPEAVAGQIREAMVRTCAPSAPGFVGMTCLAAGVDQMFASVVLELGGQLHAIVPSCDYESAFDDPASLARYRQLLARASDTTTLRQFPAPTEEAFLAGGQTIVDRSDLIVAVWDGLPARGTGGTADIVEYAIAQGKPVTNLWPDGASRGG